MALRSKRASRAVARFYADLAEKAVTGAALLAEVLPEDADRAALAARIHEVEHEADEATHAIVRWANRARFLPFAREDIYALASGLDDIMDFIDEAADLIVLYGVEELPAEFAEQVEVIQRCAELTAAAIPRIGTRNAGLEEYWIEINRLENSGDRSYRQTLAKLFSGHYAALEVLKLKDIVDSLEAAIDAFERVANIVEQLQTKAR